MKSKFYYVSFELNSDYDKRHIDDNEIEELSLLAYIEEKAKILKLRGNVLSSNSISKNRQELKQKLFSSAAELMMATGNN
jgi:predicted phosphatase